MVIHFRCMQISLLKPNAERQDAYRLKTHLFLHWFLNKIFWNWIRFSKYSKFSDNHKLDCFEIFQFIHGLLQRLQKKIQTKIFMNGSQESLDKFEMVIHCSVLPETPLNVTRINARSHFEKTYKSETSSKITAKLQFISL